MTASAADFVTVDGGDASVSARRICPAGIKTQDDASFGAPQHVRIPFLPIDATFRFLDELDRLMTSTQDGEGGG